MRVGREPVEHGGQTGCTAGHPIDERGDELNRARDHQGRSGESLKTFIWNRGNDLPGACPTGNPDYSSTGLASHWDGAIPMMQPAWTTSVVTHYGESPCE